MQRWLKLRDAFPKSADEYTKPAERLLRVRRAEMDATWGTLEEGWKANNERMVQLGLSLRSSDEGVIKLNVGGSNVNVCWHLLADAEGFKDSILGALLEGVWGEDRIPRDADGRIVLDESPVCIKHIIHKTLTGRSNSNAKGLPECTAPSAVARDEEPCLIYTAYVMGLWRAVPLHEDYVKMNGGSITLKPYEVAPFNAAIRCRIRSWPQMTLVYRATRDGFNRKALTARCKTDIVGVSLVRVRSSDGKYDDSVFAGIGTLPVSDQGEKWQLGEVFALMLKDGSATHTDVCERCEWDPHPCCAGNGFVAPRRCKMVMLASRDISGGWTLKIEEGGLCIPNNYLSLALSGKTVVDVEVYQNVKPVQPATTASCNTKPDTDVLTGAEAHDSRSFGESIAASLAEERGVLDHAIKEMATARAKVSAAVVALQTVYGPSVAAGEQDDIVELNVRGTRMTTLRSTLQACTRSALAAMFNEDRWPATDKDKDEHGRRLMDCNPACFSKILDVLRMRKRASWSRGAARQEPEEGSIGGSGAVLIKRVDVEVFGETVNMYFPGCESFIMDLVQPV